METRRVQKYLEETNKSSDLILWYDNELDIYILGVSHWGTSWNYVPTEIKIKKKRRTKKMKEINIKLMNIQQELKAPKGQYNSFGKYAYRSCEDILEAVNLY